MDQSYNHEERRHFTRISFDAEVLLMGVTGRWAGHLLDISLKGALVSAPAGLEGELGDSLLLEFSLDAGDTVVRMETVIAHREQNQLGLRCEHIDLDSASHLRRLVELNLGNATLLDRELWSLAAG